MLVDPDSAFSVGGGVGEGSQAAPVRPEDADVGVREAAVVREADREPVWNGKSEIKFKDSFHNGCALCSPGILH